MSETKQSRAIVNERNKTMSLGSLTIEAASPHVERSTAGGGARASVPPSRLRELIAQTPTLLVRGTTRRLASSRGWTPPALRPLANREHFLSEWTWMGEVDRFELVKSLRRSHGADDGSELTDDELELAVLCFEAAEEHLERERFAAAIPLLERALDVAPSFTLAWYKLALASLAVHGPNAMDSGDAADLLRCAASLEGGSEHLRANVDLVLRVHSRVEVPDEYWRRERCPRSAGDVVALVAMVRKSEWYAERLRAERSAHARSARVAHFEAPACGGGARRTAG